MQPTISNVSVAPSPSITRSRSPLKIIAGLCISSGLILLSLAGGLCLFRPHIFLNHAQPLIACLILGGLLFAIGVILLIVVCISSFKKPMPPVSLEVKIENSTQNASVLPPQTTEKKDGGQKIIQPDATKDRKTQPKLPATDIEQKDIPDLPTIPEITFTNEELESLEELEKMIKEDEDNEELKDADPIIMPNQDHLETIIGEIEQEESLPNLPLIPQIVSSQEDLNESREVTSENADNKELPEDNTQSQDNSPTSKDLEKKDDAAEESTNAATQASDINHVDDSSVTMPPIIFTAENLDALEKMTQKNERKKKSLTDKPHLTDLLYFFGEFLEDQDKESTRSDTRLQNHIPDIDADQNRSETASIEDIEEAAASIVSQAIRSAVLAMGIEIQTETTTNGSRVPENLEDKAEELVSLADIQHPNCMSNINDTNRNQSETTTTEAIEEDTKTNDSALSDLTDSMLVENTNATVNKSPVQKTLPPNPFLLLGIEPSLIDYDTILDNAEANS